MTTHTPSLMISTITMIGIYGFTIGFMVTIGRQIARIFATRSVETLSTTWIVYFAAMFSASVKYGVDKQDVPLWTSNAVMAILHYGLVAGILKYRGFNRGDWILTAALLLAIRWMWITPEAYREWWFVGFCLGGVLAILKQARTIYTENKTGVVERPLLIAYVVSNVFWTVYALTGPKWTLKLISPSNLIACSVLLAIWILVRRRADQRSAVVTSGGE